MNYIAVRETENPNEENEDYQNTIGLLYGVAYTIKMSYKGTHKIEGFFEYVVPPLEGLWWQDGIKGMDYYKKNRRLKCYGQQKSWPFIFLKDQLLFEMLIMIFYLELIYQYMIAVLFYYISLFVLYNQYQY